MKDRTIVDIIEDSKYIWMLKDNYDDEGGIPPTQKTWGKAAQFAEDYPFDLEGLYHGPNGSIDIMYDGLRLGLVNVKPDGSINGFWEEK